MPQKVQVTNFPGYDAVKLLSIAYGALEQLGWTIKYAGNNILVAYTPKSWNKYDKEITIKTEDSRLEVTSKMIHGEAFDMMGRNKKHIHEFTAAFESVKSKTTDLNINEWNDKIIALRGETVKIAEVEIKKAEEVDKVMNISNKKLYITYGLIAINTLLFVLMVADGIDIMQPKPWEVLKWGGSFAPMDLSGDWWRVFTCMFLHFGIIHLGLNMYALYSVGSYLEPMLGKSRYLVAYLSSGLLAGMLSIFWRKSEYIIAAGASGAIFGMFGVFLALLTTNIIPKHVRKTLLQSILIFVAYNVFYGFSKNSGIDNAAHLGGLISGMAIGYIYYLTYKNPSPKKTQTIVVSVAVATALALFVFFSNQKMPRVKVDYKTGAIFSGKFEEKYYQFSLVEVKALAPEGDSSLTDNQRVDQYERISVPAWDEAGQIVDEMERVVDTDIDRAKVKVLAEYVDLRKQLIRVEIKAIKENTDQYNEERNKLVEKINNVLKDGNFGN